MPITYNIDTKSVPGNIAVFKDDQGLITEDSGYPLTSQLVGVRRMESVGNITPGAGLTSDLVDVVNLYGSVVIGTSPYRLKKGNYLAVTTFVLTGTFNLTAAIGQSVFRAQIKYNGILSGPIYNFKTIIAFSGQNELDYSFTVISPLINVKITDTFTFAVAIDDFGGDSTVSVSPSPLFLYNFDPN